MWRHRSVTAMAVVSVVWMMAPAASASSAPAVSDFTIDAAPAALTLGPGDSADVAVILRNDSDTVKTVTAVEVVGSMRAETLLSGFTFPLTIAPRSAASGVLRLTTDATVRDETIAVVVRYGGGAAATSIASAEIAVTAGEAASAPTVTLHAVPAILNDGEQRRAAVEVSNTTPFILKNVVVAPLTDDDVEVKLASHDPKEPWVACTDTKSTIACLDSLNPGEVQLLDLSLVAADSVRTGKHHVGVVVTAGQSADEPAGSTASDRLPRVSVVASGTVELRVFGVDALSPFGISVLFVVPGLVALIVFLLLARWLYPRTASVPETVEITDLRALPVIVPIAAAAYFVAWVVLGRDVTRSLGTTDVALLFSTGMGIGVALWGAMSVTYYRRYDRKQFRIDDGVRTVLRRLTARHQTTGLPGFDVDGTRYVVLDRLADGSVLAAPQIEFAFAESVKPKDRETFRQKVREIDLRSVLRRSRRGRVRLRWSGAGRLASFDTTAHPASAKTQLLVETQMP